MVRIGLSAGVGRLGQDGISCYLVVELRVGKGCSGSIQALVA